MHSIKQPFSLETHSYFPSLIFSQLILPKESIDRLLLRVSHLVAVTERTELVDGIDSDEARVSIGQTAAATFCLQLQRARHAPDSAINVCSSIDFAFSLFFRPSGCRPGLLRSSELGRFQVALCVTASEMQRRD